MDVFLRVNQPKIMRLGLLGKLLLIRILPPCRYMFQVENHSSYSKNIITAKRWQAAVQWLLRPSKSRLGKIDFSAVCFIELILNCNRGPIFQKPQDTPSQDRLCRNGISCVSLTQKPATAEV